MLYEAVLVPKTLIGKHSLVPLYQNSILHPHTLKVSIHKILSVDAFNFKSEHGSYSLWDFCLVWFFSHALYFWELPRDLGKVIVYFELSMCLYNVVIPFFFPFNLTVCWYNFTHPHMNAAAFFKKGHLKIAKHPGKLSCIEEVKPSMLAVITVLGNVYYGKMCSLSKNLVFICWYMLPQNLCELHLFVWVLKFAVRKGKGG